MTILTSLCTVQTARPRNVDPPGGEGGGESVFVPAVYVTFISWLLVERLQVNGKW